MLTFLWNSVLGWQLIYRWCRKTTIVVADPSCFHELTAPPPTLLFTAAKRDSLLPLTGGEGKHRLCQMNMIVCCVQGATISYWETGSAASPLPRAQMATIRRNKTTSKSMFFCVFQLIKIIYLQCHSERRLLTNAGDDTASQLHLVRTTSRQMEVTVNNYFHPRSEKPSY